MAQQYRITLLPGDGIGPEIMAVAVDVLKVVGKQLDLRFEFQQALIGGAAIDAAFTISTTSDSDHGTLHNSLRSAQPRMVQRVPT